jgi:hypothetical protein
MIGDNRSRINHGRGDWLRSFGLGQNEALFRENEIDAKVLPELTDGDLEKIGVPLGHRKRLLRLQISARQRLRRRLPIAVMFWDLVGSLPALFADRIVYPSWFTASGVSGNCALRHLVTML